jgi:hypothetical protein
VDPFLGWILLAVIYIPRVIIPWSNVGYVHNVELYILGMVVHVFPLKGNDALVRTIRNYWPFMFSVLLLLGMPGMTGRCDLSPPNTYLERLRFYAIECILTVCFVSGGFNTADPLRVTRWLTPWALFAYVFHVALYRLSPEYGAIVTYGCVLLFYVKCRLSEKWSGDTVNRARSKDIDDLEALTPTSRAVAV